MDLKKYFKEHPVVKNRVIMVTIVIVVSALFQLAVGLRKDYIILKKDLRIVNLSDKVDSNLVKRDSLQLLLEKTRGNNYRLQIELVQCQAEYNLIQASLDDIPLPCWIRDAKTGYIVYVNDAFERQVLIPMGKNKFDLLGKPDDQIFGKALADSYKIGDDYVRMHLTPFEKIDTSKNKKGKIRRWKSNKYPIFENKGKLTHIGGIAYSIE